MLAGSAAWVRLAGVDVERLRAMAARQEGLFTRAQALACGFSGPHVGRRVAAGHWQRVGGAVLAESGLVVTRPVRDRAIQLGVAGSVLAGPSAAAWWELPVRPETDTTWVCAPRRRRPVAGIRVIVEDVPTRDRTRINGVPVTTRERTVFDCLWALPVGAAQDLLDRALQQLWITPAALSRRLGAFVGRHGVGQVVQVARVAAAGSRFPAERRCVQLLTAAGVTGWTANFEIRDDRGVIGVGDLVFEAARPVVEVDGWAFHRTPDQFQRDRHRQNRLIAAGWSVLRFTWTDLTTRPHYVAATVRAVLAAS